MKKYIFTLCCLSILTIGCNKTTIDKVMTEPAVTVDPALAWRSQVPTAGKARPIQLGESTNFTLDNGLKVIVVENHKLPRVSYQLSLNNEGIVEGDKAGYVSIAGTLLKTGTKTKSKNEIDEAIDYIGANMNTSGGGVFGSSLTKHQDKLLDIMTDVLYNPAFKKDEFEKIKKQEASGIASSKADPNAMASNVANVLNFGKDHPYGEIMTEATLERVTVADCKNYYDKYFKPNNAYLVVVGDITPETAKEKVNKYFGSWKKGNVQEIKYDTPASPDGAKVAVVNKDGAVQSVIRITYPVEQSIASPDRIASTVMNSILGGGIFSGRLMQNLREDKAYTYGARSSLSANPVIGNFSAFASVRNEVTDSSVHEFLYELDRLVTTDVSQEDLNLVKNSMSGSFARSLESPQTIARFARNISKYDLPADYYETYLQKLDAVSVADVRAAAKKYIRPENAHIVVVGSKDDIAEKLMRFDSDGVIDYYDAYGNVVEYDDEPLPDGVTAESVLQDYVSAIGGKDKLMSVKSISASGGMEMMGQKMTLETVQMAPNKMKMKMAMGPQVVQDIVFDGTKASSAGRVLTEGPEFEDAKENAMMFPQLEYAKMGYTAELKGTEPMKEGAAYKIVLTAPNGNKKTQFYDLKSSLLVKEINTQEGPGGQSMSIESIISDYKEVGGILIPHSISVIGAAPVPLNMVMDKIEVNSSAVTADMFMIK
jgi:predicted Zn-dependent peptidase